MYRSCGQRMLYHLFFIQRFLLWSCAIGAVLQDEPGLRRVNVTYSRVFWVHVRKTGTSFGNVVISYGCDLPFRTIVVVPTQWKELDTTFYERLGKTLKDSSCFLHTLVPMATSLRSS
ncbi:hypothetical protein CYMTET_6964 [Cymbomonas tetramitiformis]|uniref:Secreted protein n=1 Tax=Cymbomonas tetramitiformis TaxID=36881 RepID=A0AAE0GWE5_9CHLO|nr:hypothetical protein CYMTET_6964 [Cymbomonas tetramitiformis]